MNSKNIEIELKFEVENENEILNKLKKLGAEKIFDGVEHNEIFVNDVIREKKMLLRLRKAGQRNILTLKTNIEKGEFKRANEFEIEISNFSCAKTILENLGFEVFWIYEKIRKDFKINDVKVSVDKLPFGVFVEIEGNEKRILETAQKLGLDIRNGLSKTYMDLYREYCEQRGLEMENLIFWKKSSSG
ncbi:MAG: class IV adenylate cyclase [Candidatus Aenigmarchaeota archaeon]|nr:class IV adenylate cyclase [Candidatus Aenigmarchaeota archaeon]